MSSCSFGTARGLRSVIVKALIRSTLRDLYPPSPDLPGIDDTGVDAYLDQFRAEAPTTMYAGLLAGTALYQLSPIATIKKPLPAALLRPEDKERHAQAITKTSNYPARQMIFLVKMIAGMCWAKDDRVRQKMNLDPYQDDPGTWRSE